MTDQNQTIDPARLAIQAKPGGAPNHVQKTICVDTSAVLGKLPQTWQQRLDQMTADGSEGASAKTIKVDMESILSHLAKTRNTETPVVSRRYPVRAMVLATIALLAVLGLVFSI